MEFLYSFARFFGFLIIRYMLPVRWRREIDDSSDLAAIIGLLFVVFIVVLFFYLVIKFQSIL
ncbi:hypothetical protein MNBD_GAMMA17-533 [hydrothermal vent metagenome]|uniref:Uncharacterized protein n=1 Tax=hydrothermal vent metagenome TaxID=652676 RepID=A0A3B0ZFF4_9ZZZZ